MSGDNRLPKSSASDYCVGGPAIILVKPQLGENIGMVSRAMLNCGLNDLRLVNPRDGWSYEKAEKAAAGSGVVLNNLKVFDTTEEAIADLNHVFATTARGRDMNKPVVTPRKAVAKRVFCSVVNRADCTMMTSFWQTRRLWCRSTLRTYRSISPRRF